MKYVDLITFIVGDTRIYYSPKMNLIRFNRDWINPKELNQKLISSGNKFSTDEKKYLSEILDFLIDNSKNF